MGKAYGLSFEETSEDAYLLDYSVVVRTEADKVIGCTTGRLSTGASPPPPSEGRSGLGGVRTELIHSTASDSPHWW